MCWAVQGNVRNAWLWLLTSCLQNKNNGWCPLLNIVAHSVMSEYFIWHLKLIGYVDTLTAAPLFHSLISMTLTMLRNMHLWDIGHCRTAKCLRPFLFLVYLHVNPMWAFEQPIVQIALSIHYFFYFLILVPASSFIFGRFLGFIASRQKRFLMFDRLCLFDVCLIWSILIFFFWAFFTTAANPFLWCSTYFIIQQHFWKNKKGLILNSSMSSVHKMTQIKVILSLIEKKRTSLFI